MKKAVLCRASLVCCGVLMEWRCARCRGGTTCAPPGGGDVPCLLVGSVLPVPPREDFCLCFWGHLICSLHLLTISPDVVSLGPLCRLPVRAGNQCPPSLQFSSGGILPFSCFCVLGGALFQRAPPQQGLGTYVGPWAGFPIRLGSAGWLSSSMDTCPALSGEWVGLTASRGQGVLPGAVWQNHFSSRQVRAFLGLEGWISSL